MWIRTWDYSYVNSDFISSLKYAENSVIAEMGYPSNAYRRTDSCIPGEVYRGEEIVLYDGEYFANSKDAGQVTRLIMRGIAAGWDLFELYIDEDDETVFEYVTTIGDAKEDTVIRRWSCDEDSGKPEEGHESTDPPL